MIGGLKRRCQMFLLRSARRRLSRLATGRAVACSFLILLVLGVGLVAWWQLDTSAEDQAHAGAARGVEVIAPDVSRGRTDRPHLANGDRRPTGATEYRYCNARTLRSAG